MRRHTSSPTHRRNRLIAAGLLLLLSAHLTQWRLPINKNLWTSSFVLLTGGISLLVLAALFHAVDLKRLHKRSHLLRILDWPWLVLGSNAITAYAFSMLLEKTLSIHPPRRPLSLGSATYRTLFARRQSTPLRSFAYAATIAAVCFLPNLLLWRKRIFIKI
jgi:predicted acyltransferase